MIQKNKSVFVRRTSQSGVMIEGRVVPPSLAAWCALWTSHKLHEVAACHVYLRQPPPACMFAWITGSNGRMDDGCVEPTAAVAKYEKRLLLHYCRSRSSIIFLQFFAYSSWHIQIWLTREESPHRSFRDFPPFSGGSTHDSNVWYVRGIHYYFVSKYYLLRIILYLRFFPFFFSS